VKEPIVPQFTEGQYLHWEELAAEKHELHHGFVVAFASGTIQHDEIAFRVRNVLERLYPAPCRTFGSDVKIKLSADTFYYPDVGVVCEPVDSQSTFVERPHVVVEVLSPRTRAYDIVEKRGGYRSLPSLTAYVIVHTDIRRVEVDTRGFGGVWQTAYFDEDSARFDDRSIDLNDIYGPPPSA
jgi:Uma2 family endonuclease